MPKLTSEKMTLPVRWFRKKESSNKILVLGLPYFAQKAAQTISNDSWKIDFLHPGAERSRFGDRTYLLRAGLRLLTYDVVYQIGGPTVSGHLLTLCRLLRKPFVLHWVGSDVTQATRCISPAPKPNSGVIHWVDAPWLADELKTIGINSEVVPLCAVDTSQALPLPSGRFTVLCYLPDGRFQFYGGDLVVSAAEALPDINFLVVGGSGKNISAPPNMSFVGWQSDMQPIYAQCHALVRMASHDGLSFMVVESLNLGRYVIWNRPFEGAILAKDSTKVIAQLRSLADLYDRGVLPLNELGRQKAAEQFDQRLSSSRIRKSLLSAAKFGMRLKKPRALVCGIPFFASRAVALLRSAGWDTLYFDTQSRHPRWKSRLTFMRAVLRTPSLGVMYQLGGPTVYPRLFELCKLFKRPIVLHWLGSDVLQVTNSEVMAQVARQHESGLIADWTCAPWLVDELTPFGVSARWVAPNMVMNGLFHSLPSAPLTILVYLPDERFEFYGGQMVISLANRFREMRFIAVGGSGKKVAHPENMEFLGWRSDMDPIYERCHVLLRMAQHDGLSFMVTEALNRGRHVIWNYRFPYAILANSEADVARELESLQESLRAGTLTFNWDGYMHVQNEFNEAKVRARVDLALKSVIND